MTPRDAYETGRADLRAGNTLWDHGRSGCWILPWAILRARAARPGDPLVAALAPGWGALSPGERTAAAILWEVLSPGGTSSIDLMEKHSHVMTEVYCLHAESRPPRRTGHRLDARDPLALENAGNVRQNPFRAAVAIVRATARRQGLFKVPASFAKSVDDPDFPDFLASHPDPDLWHLIAADFNWDLPQMPGLLSWIVQQDACDAGTAALILLATRCPRVVGRRRRGMEGYAALAAEICLRSEGRGFARRALSVRAVAPDLADGIPAFLREMKASMPFGHVLLEHGATPWLRDRIKRHLVPDLVPRPVTLFAEPFGTEAPRTPWAVEDDCTIRAA